MIQANISEVKNRLSYYLRLVKGGEQVEILDRKTPLARIVHVSNSPETKENTSAWIHSARELGLVIPPSRGPIDLERLEEDPTSGVSKRKTSGVLGALLEERAAGR